MSEADKLRKGRNTKSWLKILLLILLGVAFYLFVWPALRPRRPIVRSIICSSKLHKIGKTMERYAAENDNKYPTCENWCDLLVEKADVEEEYFKCPADKKDARCSYAMNPDCRPDSVDDVVLLFEANGGWNQFGGLDLLSMENHYGEGCNILFNDGNVEFIKTKDIGKLKWKGEE